MMQPDSPCVGAEIGAKNDRKRSQYPLRRIHMKKLFTLIALVGLGSFVAGCDTPTPSNTPSGPPAGMQPSTAPAGHGAKPGEGAKPADGDAKPADENKEGDAKPADGDAKPAEGDAKPEEEKKPE
jgi:hypothetical protein